MRASMKAWLRALHVRAALAAAPLLLLLGLGMFMLLQHYSAQAALEAGQRMNLGLARYVVAHQPGALLGADGQPDRARMKALAGQVMAINPAVEVYLLDDRGQVMAHALDGLHGAPDPIAATVDMQPMQRLLQAAANVADVRLPVLGTDPREPGRSNTFTVAPVQGEGGKMGYLYIVLNGRMAQNVSASLANSDALRAMAVGAGLASLFAGLVLTVTWRKLTRPLRALAQDVRAFRSEGSLVERFKTHDEWNAQSLIPILSQRQRVRTAELAVASSRKINKHAAPAGGDEITVLRHAIQHMQARIAQQFRQLEDSDRQRRELMSNISHDLRTPLSNIQGYVQTVLLRADTLDAAARATHLRTALRHVELLGKRVGDLFELSKLDAGRVTPRQEVFCLAELLQDVVQNYRLTAQQRGVALQLSAGSHAKAKVQADIAMIERVLQNLVDNALRYTAAGGRVELRIEDRGSCMQISVSDTGRGIEAEHLPHIFERYWRAVDADTDASTATTSSGLGLAIVKRILDLHGSAVRVQSERQRGTCFEFLLPQAA